MYVFNNWWKYLCKIVEITYIELFIMNEQLVAACECQYVV